MKLIIKSFNPVAHWKWNLTNLKPIYPNQEPEAAPGLTEPEETDESNDKDLCGIFRVAFEGCCPDCKVPGEDCPLKSSKQSCPMDRWPWVTAGGRADEATT
ncbi:hypothetical protein PSHT_00005 [Puccinia striiformis]|uniref:Anaphase-promoting complex subunit 11 RING-H2 finger domain-containing protein n=1 Tax=Puccinia striiformis TaxID=27350 RepID=A0A2S4WP65_9BASI|nr:hypothetical protein PSHT_00005 [Puccinia striiformis]